MAGKTRKARGGLPIRVIHRVNARLVTTECRSVRDSNVSGFIELSDIVRTDFQEALGPVSAPATFASLVIPKVVVVAIAYPLAGSSERVVMLRPAEADSTPD